MHSIGFPVRNYEIPLQTEKRKLHSCEALMGISYKKYQSIIGLSHMFTNSFRPF